MLPGVGEYGELPIPFLVLTIRLNKPGIVIARIPVPTVRVCEEWYESEHNTVPSRFVDENTSAAGPPGIPVLKTQNSPRQRKNSRKFPFGKMLDFVRSNTKALKLAIFI